MQDFISIGQRVLAWRASKKYMLPSAREAVLKIQLSVITFLTLRENFVMDLSRSLWFRFLSHGVPSGPSAQKKIELDVFQKECLANLRGPYIKHATQIFRGHHACCIDYVCANWRQFVQTFLRHWAPSAWQRRREQVANFNKLLWVQV